MRPFILLSCRVFETLALAGAMIVALNGTHYLYRLLAWGVKEQWHFAYVSGWGFPFLNHLLNLILAMILCVPFWMFKKTCMQVQIPSTRNLINFSVLGGLLVFVLAVGAEIWLTKNFP